MLFTPTGRRPNYAGALMLSCLLAAPSSHSQTTFSDVSDAAGIGVQTESYGAAWGDLNGDRYPDLYLNNHRLQSSLYLNLGNGTFFDTQQNVKPWVNRSSADTHGGTFADFDNDGDQDLLISLGTGNPSQFLVNDYGALLDKTVEFGVAREYVCVPRGRDPLNPDTASCREAFYEIVVHGFHQCIECGNADAVSRTRSR